MMQTPSILSPLPVFAANMFGHAIGARLNSPVNEVGIIFHQAWPDVEYFPSSGTSQTFLNASLINKRGATAFTIKGEPNGGDYANSAGVDGMSYQPGATATVELSLLLKLTRGFKLDSLKNQMRAAKIGGGQVLHYKKILEFGDDLSEVFSKLPSGYWVSDASEVVKKRMALGYSIAESVLTQIKSTEGVQSGWFVPVTLGYSTITSFKQRNGARDSLPHAFAEPILGLTQLVSVGLIKRQETLPQLWKNRWINSDATSIFHIYQ